MILRDFRSALKSGLLLAMLWTCSSQSSATSALSLNELTKIAIQNNKDLRTARYNISLARARLVQSGLWPNPSLNVSNMIDRPLTNEGEYTRSLGFNQNFPVSGRISQQKNLARVDIAMAMAEICNAKRQLKNEVTTTYYAIVISDQRLKQLRELLAIDKQLVQVTQNRFQAAEVSELDVNTAKLEYQRILQEKQVLDSLRISQTAQLNQLLGRDAATALVLKQDLPGLIHLPPLAEAQDLAIKQRPDMQMTWLSVHRAKADQQLARVERWADWSVGLAIQQSKDVIDGAPPQSADLAWGVNISIPFPLFNANQGRIMETGLAGTQALTKLQALKLTIQTEIASNYAQVNALQKALKHPGVLKLANNNVQLARNAYRNGQISLLEVLQVQRQQYELQVTQLNMLEKYMQALVRFCTALGSPTASCPYLSDTRNFNAFSSTKNI